MNINPEDETSYTTQYQEALLKSVEKEYCAKRQGVPVNKRESLLSSNPILSAMAPGCCQSSFLPYDLSSDDEEYLTPNNVADTTPTGSDHAARLLTTGRLYWNSLPEAPRHWGQSNPNLIDYHSDPTEITSTFWLPDITDWWRHQEQTHSNFTYLTYVVHDIFPIIPHGVGVEASCSFGQDVICWRQSKTTGNALPEDVGVRQFSRANIGILAALTQNWMQRKQKTTCKWNERRKKGHCTEWPRFQTFWRCGRAAKTYVLPRRNHTLKIGRWRLTDTFWTRTRSSEHLGHCFNMTVRLHVNCQEDPVCHHLCQQRTSQEAELKYWISGKSDESTVIQWKVMRLAHLKAFRTLKISSTGMGTYIIQMTGKTIAWRTLNLILSKTTAARICNAQNNGTWAQRQMIPDWFSLHGNQRGRLKSCWWWLMPSKRGGIREWRQGKTQCVKISPASLCISTEGFS